MHVLWNPCNAGITFPPQTKKAAWAASAVRAVPVAAVPVAAANYLSSLPAITYVFLVSTRRLLACRTERASRLTKYLVYALYQLALVSAASFAMQALSGALTPVTQYHKLAAKILITPFTMTANFFVLRAIAEKW